VVADPRWRIYDHYLGSARQGHEDRSVLRILQEHEVDLREPRRIEHRLHFPTDQAATEASRALRDAGFEEIEPASFPEGRWSLVISVVDAPMPVPLAQRRAWFSAFCTAMGGEYDGWGTGIEPSRRKRRPGAR
jgi:hypothetical protein